MTHVSNPGGGRGGWTVDGSKRPPPRAHVKSDLSPPSSCVSAGQSVVASERSRETRGGRSFTRPPRPPLSAHHVWSVAFIYEPSLIAVLAIVVAVFG